MPENRMIRSAPAILSPVLLHLLPLVSAANAQSQLWLTQFGTSENDSASALTTDGAGGTIVVGSTQADLGGPNAGAGDAFVSRYDEDGNRRWIKQFGTEQWDEIWGVAPGDMGGTLISGYTGGDLRGLNAGSYDAIVGLYDTDGNEVWLRQFGTISGDQAFAVAPAAEGNAWVAGQFNGGNAFIALYDHQGTELWLREFGTSDSDAAYAVVADGAGGVFIAGTIERKFVAQTAYMGDAYIARYDEKGNQLWLEQFGTSHDEWASAIVLDGAGGVFVAGGTHGGLGGPSAGALDSYITRYDGAGNRIWIRQFGTGGDDHTRAMTPDGAGGVLIAGGTEGSLGSPNAGKRDAFISRFASDGDRLFMRQFGSTGTDLATGLLFDGPHKVMIVGATAGELGGPSAGRWDAFLARYTIDSCYADCDQSTGGRNGVLDIFDFLCWQNDFVIGNSYACDCDMSTGPLVCDVLDFLCFQEAFVAGCP